MNFQETALNLSPALLSPWCRLKLSGSQSKDKNFSLIQLGKVSRRSEKGRNVAHRANVNNVIFPSHGTLWKRHHANICRRNIVVQRVRLSRVWQYLSSVLTGDEFLLRPWWIRDRDLKFLCFVRALESKITRKQNEIRRAKLHDGASKNLNEVSFPSLLQRAA